MVADIKFTRAYQDAIPPMPADKAALGFIPIAAFQYCEAVRVASAMGWYIFPPKTISLMFDGRETFLADEGQWRAFTHEPLEPAFTERWDSLAPAHLRGHAPSYLRRFSQPGIVQIWSGLFVETRRDLWLHIRPIVNKNDVSSFSCFEAIVETDSFRPTPLMMNIQIHRTDREILIEKDMPLFQVCAIEKSSVRQQSAVVADLGEATEPLTEGQPLGFDWDGLMKTLRIPGVTPEREAIGTYAAKARKQEKLDAR